MSKVLVTGSRGMLGATLVPFLRTCGHELICHSRHGEGDIHADLVDAVQVRSMLDSSRPDVILNLAALANVDECERNPHKAYLENVKIVENLVDWIRHAETLAHLVQISTDQVYDDQGPHKEDSVALKNYYAFSKYAGELAAQAVPSTILRTNFFGPSRCEGRISLSDWIVASLRQKKQITVFGDVWVSPLSMETLSEAIALVIAQRHRGVFNLGSRIGMSKADFAFALAGKMQFPTDCMMRGSISQLKFEAYRPRDMQMDSGRFEHLFGMALPTLLEEIDKMGFEYEPQAC